MKRPAALHFGGAGQRTGDLGPVDPDDIEPSDGPPHLLREYAEVLALGLPTEDEVERARGVAPQRGQGRTDVGRLGVVDPPDPGGFVDGPVAVGETVKGRCRPGGGFRRGASGHGRNGGGEDVGQIVGAAQPDVAGREELLTVEEQPVAVETAVRPLLEREESAGQPRSRWSPKPGHRR